MVQVSSNSVGVYWRYFNLKFWNHLFFKRYQFETITWRNTAITNASGWKLLNKPGNPVLNFWYPTNMVNVWIWIPRGRICIPWAGFAFLGPDLHSKSQICIPRSGFAFHGLFLNSTDRIRKILCVRFAFQGPYLYSIDRQFSINNKPILSI